MKTDIEIYSKVLAFAMRAHHGQMRDDGETKFIIHPIRVAEAVCRNYNIDYVVVALLHDVIEDSNDPKIVDKTVLYIKSVYENNGHQSIIDALDAITKRKNETKEEYYNRVSHNNIALVVKIYDRMDNLNDMGSFSNKRAHKYAQESKNLCAILDKASINFHPFVRTKIVAFNRLCDEKMKEFTPPIAYYGIGDVYVTMLKDGSFVLIHRRSNPINDYFVVYMFDNSGTYIWSANDNAFHSKTQRVKGEHVFNLFKDANDVVEKYAQSLE